MKLPYTNHLLVYQGNLSYYSNWQQLAMVSDPLHDLLPVFLLRDAGILEPGPSGCKTDVLPLIHRSEEVCVYR